MIKLILSIMKRLYEKKTIILRNIHIPAVEPVLSPVFLTVLNDRRLGGPAAVACRRSLERGVDDSGL